MRRILTAFAGATMVASLAAAVAATTYDVTIAEGGITVECFTNENLTQIVISGDVTVVSGTADFTLELHGNKPGQGSFAFLIDSVVIDNTGPGTYPYTFTIAAATIDAYNSLRVEATGSGGATVTPEKSRSFKDECRTAIPEVPVLGFLLLSGALTAAFVVWRKSATRPTMATA